MRLNSVRWFSSKNVNPQAIACWGLPCVGALALIWSVFGPENDLVRALVPLGYVTFFVFGLVIHELGHFFVGKWLGEQPFYVVIGSGPPVWEFYVRGVTFHLRTVPWGGFVLSCGQPGDQGESRWQRMLMILAGPLTNLVLALLVLPFATGSFAVAAPLKAVCRQLCLTNGWIVLINLIPVINLAPRTAPIEHNDGLLLVRELKRRGKNRPAAADPKMSRSGWSPDSLLSLYRFYLHQPSLTEADRGQILDGFCTTVLRLCPSPYLPEAARYSEELFRLRPNELTVLGTRGSVLVEMGELEEGTRLLQRVFAEDSIAFDRGIAACYLALAAFKRCQIDEAAEWIGKARAIDLESFPLERMEQLLAAFTASDSARESPAEPGSTVSALIL